MNCATTELFFSRRLKDEWPRHRRTVLASLLDMDVFCISETVRDRRMAPRQNVFVSAMRLEELRPQTRNWFAFESW
jgi:hypothetical protein